ncbi:MAG: hypothetical protein H6978_07785 [Gammaproteobacteria bacterium]|nr:hypothetical protein [Gammaproteobacteria bacterium]
MKNLIRMGRIVPPLIIGAVLSCVVNAYPIDGYERTGIGRLEAARRIELGEIQASRQPAGGLLTTEQVDIRLRDFDLDALPAVDPAFTASVRALLEDKADVYSVSVLDLSDPAHPRYAEHAGEIPRNPGSVGKLVVALAMFQLLADLYPDDTEARFAVLRDTDVLADDFVISDHHTVRMWDRAGQRQVRKILQPGDHGSLFEFMDWMLSASSNAAGAVVMKQLVLLKQFGTRYPVSEQEADEFLRTTPKGQLQQMLADVLQTPLTRHGLDVNKLRQGSLFTRVGKQRIPGTSSHATTRELMKLMLLMERGKLVDDFSSTEFKRLMYSTERRIRYASSPALSDSAVYFKSGSLYQCEPEPDFVCRAYQGNVRNLMNSVITVEHEAQDRRLFYIVTLTSNVLRRNSAVDHQTLATRLQRLIERDHPVPPEAAPSAVTTAPAMDEAAARAAAIGSDEDEEEGNGEETEAALGELQP